MTKDDYLKILIDSYNSSTKGIWSVTEDPEIDTAWITTDEEGSKPIALFDYNKGPQNKADARFIASMHNHAEELFIELQALRARVIDLLTENTREVEKRISLQNELNNIKESQK